MIAANRQSDVQNILLRAFSFMWKYPCVSNWKENPCLVKQFVLYTTCHHISNLIRLITCFSFISLICLASSTKHDYNLTKT
jgi:hypothetical protein